MAETRAEMQRRAAAYNREQTVPPLDETLAEALARAWYSGHAHGATGCSETDCNPYRHPVPHPAATDPSDGGA